MFPEVLFRVQIFQLDDGKIYFYLILRCGMMATPDILFYSIVVKKIQWKYHGEGLSHISGWQLVDRFRNKNIKKRKGIVFFNSYFLFSLLNTVN